MQSPHTRPRGVFGVDAGALSRGLLPGLSSVGLVHHRSIQRIHGAAALTVSFPPGTCCCLLTLCTTSSSEDLKHTALTPKTGTMSGEQQTNSSSSYYFDNTSTRVQSSVVFSRPVFVVLMLVMVTLVVVIVLGNALVILAFKVDKSLRRQCNYYFLNLAISDFLVGKSHPLSICTQWKKVHQILDIMLTFASCTGYSLCNTVRQLKYALIQYDTINANKLLINAFKCSFGSLPSRHLNTSTVFAVLWSAYWLLSLSHRGFLHPYLHPLHSDRQVDAGTGAV